MSMKFIKKIKLMNFRRFEKLEVEFNENLNLLIGDNESGKSTILSAIDLVLSGSRSRVENFGLDNLFNLQIVHEFLASDKKYASLPKLHLEVYLNEQGNPDLNGRINSDEQICDGLQLKCEPTDDLSEEIKEILNQEEPNFPFEFYSISFKTFSGETYSGYKKYLRHIAIDNTQISNEYATREYVKALYNSNVSNAEKSKHQNEYRKHKESFKENILMELNLRLEEYSFAIKTSSKSNLETDLTISEGDIKIENRGKGKQCFIKTDFALGKMKSEIDIVLLEEPENHLSHVNMKKLIRKITESENKQIFIATHNDLISTRLDLRKSILLNSNSPKPVLFSNLSESTSKYFMKSSDNNLLEFILSDKVILVEGDSEYVLMDTFFQNHTGTKLEDSGIHVISVGGTSFKRYLDVAKLLCIRTAVIRDNDRNYEANCVENYSQYTSDNIKVFADSENTRYTFEVVLFQDNQAICEELFAEGRRTLTVQDHMLSNKADTAFELLDKRGATIKTPNFIVNAIEWIRN